MHDPHLSYSDFRFWSRVIWQRYRRTIPEDHTFGTASGRVQKDLLYFLDPNRKYTLPIHCPACKCVISADLLKTAGDEVDAAGKRNLFSST